LFVFLVEQVLGMDCTIEMMWRELPRELCLLTTSEMKKEKITIFIPNPRLRLSKSPADASASSDRAQTQRQTF
jgi:hypothetical protein